MKEVIFNLHGSRIVFNYSPWGTSSLFISLKHGTSDAVESGFGEFLKEFDFYKNLSDFKKKCLLYVIHKAFFITTFLNEAPIIFSKFSIGLNPEGWFELTDFQQA